MPLLAPHSNGSMSPNASSHSQTIILGAGIIGLSTAYFLSHSGHTDPRSILLVDSSPELFHCASGLAAGFLVADWFAPSISSLGALSFKLHAHLAHNFSGHSDWGYSRSTGISLSQDSEALVNGNGDDWLETGTSRAQLANHNRPWEAEPIGPQWLRRTSDGIMEVITREGTTAQIDPLRFCQWLLERCQERGVQVHYPATAVSILKNNNGVLHGLRINKEGMEIDVPCTRLVISAGPWTPRVFSSLFPAASTRIPIFPLAGHSLLIRNPYFKPQAVGSSNDPCQAVFATDTLGFSPEWFGREGGELYLAGLNSTKIPLPDVATDVQTSPDAIEQLKQCARVMMSNAPGKKLEILREGVCFRPMTSNGRPIVSRVSDEKLGGTCTFGGSQGGVFIAAGHGAWGISHGPGTGLVLAEIMEGRRTSVQTEALRLS